MDFLKYIEHSAENLQFYMWFKDYIKRFEDLPATERVLCPEWTQAQEEAEVTNYRNKLKEKPLSVEANAILRGQELAPVPVSSQSDKRNPFGDSQTDSDEKRSLESDESPRSRGTGTVGTLKTNHSKDASTAFEDAGCKFQPCKSHHRRRSFRP
jgi:hypothetical protein